MDKIYTSEPIDKTARLVVNQKGCSLEELSDEQYRENLVKRSKFLQIELLKHPKNSFARKQLGKEFAEVNLKINAIRPKKKAPGVERYFIDAARGLLTKMQFNTIMTEAVNNMNKDRQKIEST